MEKICFSVKCVATVSQVKSIVSNDCGEPASWPQRKTTTTIDLLTPVQQVWAAETFGWMEKFKIIGEIEEC